MKQKRRSPIIVKILACLLLLASLATLLLPWIKLAVDTNQGRMELTEVLALVGQDKDSILKMVDQGLASSGAPVPGQTVRELLSTVLEGKFSLPTLARLCASTAELCASLGEAEAAQTVNMVGYGIWGLLGLLALLGLIGLCCVFTDHRGGILPYLLLSILASAAVVLVHAGANRYLEEEGMALLNQWGAGILLSYFGIDIHIVKMEIAAYICPALALVALLLMGIRKRQPTPDSRETATPYPARRSPQNTVTGTQKTEPAAPGNWTCPNCGSNRSAEEKFCGLCGTGRVGQSSAARCPTCGRILLPGAAFCGNCGQRVKPVPAAQDADQFPNQD